MKFCEKCKDYLLYEDIAIGEFAEEKNLSDKVCNCYRNCGYSGNIVLVPEEIVLSNSKYRRPKYKVMSQCLKPV